MKVKTSKLKRVALNDFDASLLRSYCRQGRLFVYVDTDDAADAYKCEIMEYVERIHDMASADWTDRVRPLWEAILESPCFKDCLTMKNGMQAGHMNRYMVTNLVCRLHNKGVYCQQVSMLALHLKMENTKEKNKYYRSSSNYDLTKEAKIRLRQIFQEV